MTASRARKRAIGSDCEKVRIGSARFAMCDSAAGTARSLAAPRVRELRLLFIVHHPIAQRADARDLHFHHVTRLQISGWVQPRPRAARRSRKDHIATLERAKRRKVLNEVRNRKQHAIARVILPQFAVHSGLNPKRRRPDFIGGDEIRPQGAGTIEVLALCHIELGVAQPVTHRSLIGTRVTKYVLHGLVLTDPSAASADHDRNFALVVELLRLAWPDDRFLVCRKGGVGAHEEAGIAGPFAAVLVLLVALRVVHADAEVAHATSRGTEHLYGVQCMVALRRT